MGNYSFAHRFHNFFARIFLFRLSKWHKCTKFGDISFLRGMDPLSGWGGRLCQNYLLLKGRI